jgi:hypothetical protein
MKPAQRMAGKTLSGDRKFQPKPSPNNNYKISLDYSEVLLSFYPDIFGYPDLIGHDPGWTLISKILVNG